MDARALQVLDCFLFEDIYNNRNPDEDNWDISYVGDNYLLRDLNTGKIHNIKVVFQPGDLSIDEINQVIEDQEWNDDLC